MQDFEASWNASLGSFAWGMGRIFDHVLVQTQERKAMALQNVNPTIHEKVKDCEITQDDYNENINDNIDEREVFDILSN